MTFTNSIKLKAAILLLVFSLNSLRSLACAVHADRFVYSLVSKFDHQKENVAMLDISCDDDDDCTCPEKASNEKGCCDAKVVAFDHLDKAPSHHISGNLSIPVFELPRFFLLFAVSNSVSLTPSLAYSSRNPHAPPEDIRVSIQSFQV